MRSMALVWLRVFLILAGWVFSGGMWAMDPVTIDITTPAGKQTYEVVRLYTDRAVLLGKGGKRVEILRTQIQKAENKKVEASIQESKKLLGTVSKTPWENFPELTRKLESTATGMDQLSLMYGWLIPDASRTAAELHSVDTQVSQTLVSGSALENDLLNWHERLSKGEKLPKDWKALFEEGIKRAGSIPYSSVSKVLTSKIQSEQKQIETLLQKMIAEKGVQITKIEEELHKRLKDPAVTLDEWKELIDRMNQTAEEIPEDRARTESLEKVEDTRVKTEPWVQAAEMRRTYSVQAAGFEKIKSQVSSGEIKPVSGQIQIRSFLNSLANLPEAPTREQLTMLANEYAATLAPPPPAEPVTGVAVESGTGQETTAPPLFGLTVIIGGGVGLLIALGGLVWISHRKRQVEPVPETVSVPQPRKKTKKKEKKRGQPSPAQPSAGKIIELPVRTHPVVPVQEDEFPASVALQASSPPQPVILAPPTIEEPIHPSGFEMESIPESEEEVAELMAPAEEVIEEEPGGVLEVPPLEPVEIKPGESVELEAFGPLEFVLEQEDIPVRDDAGVEFLSGFVEISLPESTESGTVPEPVGPVTEPGLPILAEAQEEHEVISGEVVSPEPVLSSEFVLPDEPVLPFESVIPSQPVPSVESETPAEPELPMEPVVSVEPEVSEEPEAQLPDMYLFLSEESIDWRNRLESACVLSSGMEKKLRDTWTLGVDTPQELARYGPHFGACLRNGEGKNTLALLDRMSSEGVLSQRECGRGDLAVQFKVGLLWILDQESLRVSAYGEGGWVDLGCLDHPEDSSSMVLTESLEPSLFWVGERYLVGVSDRLHLYKTEKADCLLRVVPLGTTLVRKVFSPNVIALFPVNETLGTVSREGELVLTDLSGTSANRHTTLPDMDKTAAPGAFLVMESGELLYPVLKQAGEFHLRLFSLSTLETVSDSESLPFRPQKVVILEEGILLLGEHDVALLDNVDLSVSWHYPLEARVPVRFDSDGSQLALLVHDEIVGDTVLVLGKNSGADLWDLTPSEHGLKRITGLIFNVEWTLLFGQDQEGRAVLKLC